jgi:hypothetical protein
VERDLLVGGRERPGDLKSALLAEHELHLTGRPQTLRLGRPKRCARTRLRNGTEHVLVKEAVLAACFARPAPSRHAFQSSDPFSGIRRPSNAVHQSENLTHVQSTLSENAGILARAKYLQTPAV